MALNTYTGLKAAIKTWLQADELLDAQLDDFIDLAEARINRDLRLLVMEKRATLVTALEYTPLPVGYLQMRNLQINTNPIRRLEYFTPEKIDLIYGSDNRTPPRAFTIVGGEIQLAPTPTQSYTLEMAYYKRLDAISASVTNDVLLTSPDIYLYACLIEATPFLYEDVRLPIWAQAYKVAVDTLNEQDRKGRHSGSALRMVFDHGSPP